MTLDFTRPLLSDSHRVRILCTDGPGEFPVIGIWRDVVCRWTLEGGPLTGCIGVHNLTQAPEPARLQLREGGYYRRRDQAGICGPMSRNQDENGYPWVYDGCSYKSDGRLWVKQESGCDLVCEVTVTDVPLDAKDRDRAWDKARETMYDASIGKSPGGIDVLPQIGPQPGSVDAPAPISPPSPAYTSGIAAAKAAFDEAQQEDAKDRTIAAQHQHIDDLESRITWLTKCHDDDVSIIQQLHDRIAELTKPQPEKQKGSGVESE